MVMENRNLGYLYAILAAVLFGASTPAAKVLLVHVDPWLLAGLLYLGSAIGLLFIFIIQSLSKKTKILEASLGYNEWKWLGGATLLGGILGPILLMVGLSKTPASTTSLFLNFESVLTALIAWFVFKEHFDRKIALGMLSIVIGGFILSWKGTLSGHSYLGPSIIAGACLCWAMDNNLTRKISAANPLQIAMIKNLIAGVINTSLAMMFGAALPHSIILFSAGIVGFIGYGLSLVLFILSLRHIGTARTGAYFSLAPFVGAGLAIAFLNETTSIQFVSSSFFMGIGIWIHLTEHHSHEHAHEELEHDHRHVHDEHHQHEHLPTDPKSEPHAHMHKHTRIRHAHPHFPDIHHRHGH
jgi:drug/metabolite transporter (DMT)-like permease